MPIELTSLTPADRKDVIDLFNGHVRNSFAAYPEAPVGYEFYDFLVRQDGNWPAVGARSGSGELLGFGFLKPLNPLAAFAAAGEVGYFLKPEATRSGLGTRILARLEEGARARGLATILASVSSLNEPSLRFHAKQGFLECGRFHAVGRKWGRVFDLVWWQKRL